MTSPRIAAPLLLLASLFAAPAPAAAGALIVSTAYSYETPVPGVTAGGYLTLTNSGKQPDRLMRAESPAAKSVELHRMSMDGGMMQMRALPEGLAIAPGETVELAPGGLHLMLFGTAQALRAGDSLPLTLVFKKAGRVPVQLQVRAREDQAAPHAHH